jgi:hypothetical protein
LLKSTAEVVLENQAGLDGALLLASLVRLVWSAYLAVT